MLRDVSEREYFIMHFLVWRIKNKFGFHKSLVWRTQYRVNYILKEFVTPEVLAKYHPVGPIGQDKRFHPREFISFLNIFFLAVHSFFFPFFFTVFSLVVSLWPGRFERDTKLCSRE